jgi:hypothetical protein
MIARRELLASSVLSSLLTRDGNDSAADVSDRTAEDMVRALRDIHAALEAQHSFSGIVPLRQRMIEFLHANGKFPDFIDVGTEVWFTVYDWHVRNLLPLQTGRDATGRYTMAFLHATTLVLRPDSDRGFVSIPYDNR